MKSTILSSANFIHNYLNDREELTQVHPLFFLVAQEKKPPNHQNPYSSPILQPSFSSVPLLETSSLSLETWTRSDSINPRKLSGARCAGEVRGHIVQLTHLGNYAEASILKSQSA
jgi:hypothetical protein